MRLGRQRMVSMRAGARSPPHLVPLHNVTFYGTTRRSTLCRGRSGRIPRPGHHDHRLRLPAGLLVRAAEVQRYLDRRRPGSNKHGTPRREDDTVVLLSGLYQDDHALLTAGPEVRVAAGEEVTVATGYAEGYTTGEPLAALVLSAAKKSGDYAQFMGPAGEVRPGHTIW